MKVNSVGEGDYSNEVLKYPPTNKTDHQDISEITLTVVLNTYIQIVSKITLPFHITDKFYHIRLF